MAFSPPAARRVAGVVASLVIAGAVHAAPACKGTLYLALFTSNMSQAENIARTLAQRDVKATFFLANEKTVRGDYTLDRAWGDYWRARVAKATLSARTPGTTARFAATSRAGASVTYGAARRASSMRTASAPS